MSERDDFAALLDASFSDSGSTETKRLKQGSRVEGKVIQIGKDTIFVDVGTRSEGTIDRYQLEDADGNLTVEVGDTIRAVVQSGGDRPKLAIRIGGKVGAVATHSGGGGMKVLAAMRSQLEHLGTTVVARQIATGRGKDLNPDSARAVLGTLLKLVEATN